MPLTSTPRAVPHRDRGGGERGPARTGREKGRGVSFERGMSFWFPLVDVCPLENMRYDEDARLFEGNHGICAGSIGGWDFLTSKQKLRRTRSASGAGRRTALRLPLGSKRNDAKERLIPIPMAREKRSQQGQSQN